jgi:hypothetical protein
VNRQIERVYSKPCRYCGQLAIFWSDLHKYFADGPNTDSPKHACPSSSTKDRQLEQDKKLNVMLNDFKHEMDSKFDALRTDLSSQQSSTQKSIAAIRAEISTLCTLFKNHAGGYGFD